jgi:3-phenylpropionate/trans-cinnamate dioxygenase ferredoxin subunit
VAVAGGGTVASPRADPTFGRAAFGEDYGRSAPRRRGDGHTNSKETTMELIATDALSDGQMKAVELDGHELLVARVGDAYYVADARCPHMGGHLPDGTLEGTTLTCPRHHSQFDLTDGRVLRWTDWKGPVRSVAELLRHPRPLRVFEATVEDGKVMVGPQKTPPTAG